MEPLVSYKIEEGIGWVDFHIPSLSSKINQKFMESLDEVLDNLRKESTLKGVVFFNSLKGNFLGELDFQELAFLSAKNAETKIKSYQNTLQKMVDFPVPTIASIWGPCLGAALELVLACQWRLSAEEGKIRFGFSEVARGLIPCLGGTQRLSRLIGKEKALDLILSGRVIGPKDARQLGLIDQVYPMGILRQKTREFIQKITAAENPPTRTRKKKGARFGLSWLSRYFLKRKYLKSLGDLGKNPAFYKALETTLDGYPLKMEQGLSLEIKAFGELIQNPESRNLIYVNLSTESLRNHLPTSGIYPQPPKVAIVGAGNMGTEIASFLIRHDIPVRLKDINQQALGMSLKSISQKLKTCPTSPWEQRQREALLSPTTLYRGMKHAHAAVEAVIEDFEIKKRVLAEMEKATHKKTLLASTTSSFSITRLAEGTDHPERIVGLHFFYPLDKTEVVEIVKGEKTSPQTIEEIVKFAKTLGKVPLVVKDSPGFLMGRVALPYLNEALLLLQEGVLVEEIDQAMLDFGMALGPLAFVDLLGIDTLHYLANSVEKISPYFTPSALIDKFYKNGRLGQRSGKGIYLYEKNQPGRVDPKIYDLIKDLRGERTKLEPEIIVDRLLLPMIREAANCLKEEIISRPMELEIGIVLGLGFPAHRGGLLHYANERGMDSIVKGFKRLKKNLGDRFEPGEILLSYHQRKKQFTVQ